MQVKIAPHVYGLFLLWINVYTIKRWNDKKYCKINVLLQFYTDISLSEKRINNLVQCILIYCYVVVFILLMTFYFKMFISTCVDRSFNVSI